MALRKSLGVQAEDRSKCLSGASSGVNTVLSGCCPDMLGCHQTIATLSFIALTMTFFSLYITKTSPSLLQNDCCETT